MPIDFLRPIETVGGGLAGLSLGLALRRAGVEVTLHEAGDYPRHRVCGEFISGLSATTIERLGLGPSLAGALSLKTVGWFADDRLLRVQTLPHPAIGLSRFTLDQRLATAFAEAGGKLLLKSRANSEAAEGRVFATGRHPGGNEWLGLKVHVQQFTMAHDLEVHLGNEAYVGAARIDGGGVNVCGLFRRRPNLSSTSDYAQRALYLLPYLNACGLHDLVRRLTEAQIDPTSFCAVAALGFGRSPPDFERVRLGDAYALIPPFTGHGMAMAFQSAEIALDPLLAYARGDQDWSSTCQEIGRLLTRHFKSRLVAAHFLHPFLYHPPRQCWLKTAGKLGLLPLTPLYQLTH